jgi:hypothetical protein
MDSSDIPRLVLFISALSGMLGGILIIVFEAAKQRVELELFSCVALRMNEFALQGKEIPFEKLKELHIAEMKSVTGADGGLTYEEGLRILSLMTKFLGQHFPSERGKWQRPIRLARRSIPLQVVARGEYFIALFISFIFLCGVIGTRRLLPLTNPTWRDVLLPSLATFLPCLLIVFLTIKMTSWARKAIRVRKQLESNIFDTYRPS